MSTLTEEQLIDRELALAISLRKEAGHVYSECSANGAPNEIINAALAAFGAADHLLRVMMLENG